MKIPKSVRIYGVDYPVDYVDYLNDGVNIAYGHIDYDRCKIEINSSLDLDHQKVCRVIWHEIMHGIVDASGLNLDNEEEIVEMLSKGVYQVLQDNGRQFFDINHADAEPEEQKEGEVNDDCKNCIHQRICDLWHEHECQDASCFVDDCFEPKQGCAVHAHWISTGESFVEDYCRCNYWECSHCHQQISGRYGFCNYCPNCGAEMVAGVINAE